MILPILISVSVAPLSYFFCASAPVDATQSASAAAATANLLVNGIRFSLMVSGRSIAGFFSSLVRRRHSIPFGRPHQEPGRGDGVAGALRIALRMVSAAEFAAE